MKIVLAGGTGFLGSRLARAFKEDGHETVVLTRHPERHDSIRRITYTGWNSRSPEALVPILTGADAVVNLAGESIGSRRWTRKRKQRIKESRVQSTRAIVQALQMMKRAPEVLVNAAAVGFYGETGDTAVSEQAGPGTGFFAEVCTAWEHEALRAEEAGVRVVLPRMAVVLGRGGGALATMELPFRFYLGGVIGPGTQWFPWVHVDDVVEVISRSLRDEHWMGPVNIVAPEQVTMETLCYSIASILHRPCWVPVPSWLLRLVLGEMAVTVLQSQRIIPGVLQNKDYNFRCPSLLPALEDSL